MKATVSSLAVPSGSETICFAESKSEAFPFFFFNLIFNKKNRCHLEDKVVFVVDYCKPRDPFEA